MFVDDDFDDDGGGGDDDDVFDFPLRLLSNSSTFPSPNLTTYTYDAETVINTFEILSLPNTNCSNSSDSSSTNNNTTTTDAAEAYYDYYYEHHCPDPLSEASNFSKVLFEIMGRGWFTDALTEENVTVTVQRRIPKGSLWNSTDMLYVPVEGTRRVSLVFTCCNCFGFPCCGLLNKIVSGTVSCCR